MIIQQTSNPVNLATASEQRVVKPEAPAPVRNEAQAAQQSQQPTAKQLRNAVDQVNKTIQSLSNDLHFSVDEQTGVEVVKVVDRETKQVIRQIPSEEMVAIAQRLDELQGLIIRQKA